MLMILSMSPIQKKKKKFKLNKYNLKKQQFIRPNIVHNLYGFAFSPYLDFIFDLSQYTTTIVQKSIENRQNIFLKCLDLKCAFIATLKHTLEF
jgi:hypothetical protein